MGRQQIEGFRAPGAAEARARWITTPLFVIAIALVGGIFGFVPLFGTIFVNDIGKWSLTEFLGTALSLAVFSGAAFWIGYAHPRLWFCGALVTWTTTLHAVKILQPRPDLPPGVTLPPIDMTTILAILLVPICVAIVGAFAGRTRRLTKGT